jgi:hypothetical protein
MRGADMPTSPSQRINDSDLTDWDWYAPHHKTTCWANQENQS